MKMKQEHYNHILEQMKTVQPQIQEQREFIIAESKAKNVEKRLRWDIFYVCKLSNYACDVLYEYLDDTHVDTALKRIMATIDK